jgi:hypothetical protein
MGESKMKLAKRGEMLLSCSGGWNAAPAWMLCASLKRQQKPLNNALHLIGVTKKRPERRFFADSLAETQKSVIVFLRIQPTLTFYL